MAGRVLLAMYLLLASCSTTTPTPPRPTTVHAEAIPCKHAPDKLEQCIGTLTETPQQVSFTSHHKVFRLTYWFSCQKGGDAAFTLTIDNKSWLNSSYHWGNLTTTWPLPGGPNHTITLKTFAGNVCGYKFSLLPVGPQADQA